MNMRKKIIIIGIIFFLITPDFIGLAGHIVVTNKSTSLENRICSNDSDFDKKIQYYMKLGHLPSISVCVINDSGVVWSEGYGFYNMRNGKIATNTTIYPIGSITKTITATAVMQLYERGYFDLDDNVSEYLPFDLKNPHHPDTNITFRMLLAHQSSFGDSGLSLSLYFSFFNYPYSWMKEYLLPEGKIYWPRVWLKIQPGKGVFYSSTNSEILAYLVEEMTDQPFYEYCKRHIFNPLDMKNTSWHLDDFDINDIAVPYIWKAGWYFKGPIFEYHCYGCGGIWTNVLDLSHYLMAYMNNGIYNGNRILQEDTVELMYTLQYPDSWDGNARYGLGWYFWTGSDGKSYGGHGGMYTGAFASMISCLSDGTGIIFFRNQYDFIFHKLHHRSKPFEKYAYNQIKELLFEKAREL